MKNILKQIWCSLFYRHKSLTYKYSSETNGLYPLIVARGFCVYCDKEVITVKSLDKTVHGVEVFIKALEEKRTRK